MKTLLVAVNAKYIHSNPAVYSLKAYAADDNVIIREYTINQNMEDVLADIYAAHADTVAFSCYIWNIRYVEDLAEQLHLLCPKVHIWLGGPEVGYSPEVTYRKLPFVEAIIVGEGEKTFKEMISGEKPLREIKGLALPDGSSTGEREPLDLSEIPFLYEDVSKFGGRILYYESSRGCPYRCAYCLSSIEKCVRLKPIEMVKRELKCLIDQRPELVKFVDRTFNCNRKQAEEIWRFLIENDNGVTCFHFEIAAELMTDEQLDLIGQMRTGLIQLEIGVQSTNERTLAAINRSCDLDHLKEVTSRIHEGGNIHQHLDLIAGLPYEDYESFRHSFDDVFALHPDQLQLGFLKVLKGSPMMEMAKEHDIVYESKAPYEVLCTKYISYEELRLLKRLSDMVELYYNSDQFRTLLSVVSEDFPSKFDMFESMAKDYIAHGYDIAAPARSKRYDIFIDWAEHEPKVTASLKKLREAALMDLYLRENLKSRPSWAEESAPAEDRKSVTTAVNKKLFEEEIRAFYEREEAERRFLPGYADMNSKQLARQTHMEVFEVLFGEPKLVLFDYSVRHPLTMDARTVVFGVREGKPDFDEMT